MHVCVHVKMSAHLWDKLLVTSIQTIFFLQQTLLMQMNELHSQVDEIRDLAIGLMTRSSRFAPMVEPELTHLNQCWEEVAQMLKVNEYTGLTFA